MEIRTAYYVAAHRYAFRPGEAAEIIGVRIVAPREGLDARPCFEVRYPDGVIGFQPIRDDDSGYRIEHRPDAGTDGTPTPAPRAMIARPSTR